MLKYLWTCLLEVLYPTDGKCLNCLDEQCENFLCMNCESSLSFVNNKFYLGDYKTYSILYYSDIMKKLVYNFKYNKNFHVGEFFSELLKNKVKEENLEIDYITFVPMNREGIKKREFNQCEYLAKQLGEKLNVEVLDLLGKKEGIKEQKTLSSYERKKNIKDAFYIKDTTLNLTGKKVLLIDDVMTTGETLKICAQNIKKYYNIELFLLTVVKSSI